MLLVLIVVERTYSQPRPNRAGTESTSLRPISRRQKRRRYEDWYRTNVLRNSLANISRNSERKEVADHSWLDYYAALAKEEEVYMLQDVPPSALV